jgi:hypothetical protein
LFLARSARFVLLGGMCIPFQYFTDCVVSWRLEGLGC